jgi:hypothetical protein
MFGALIKQIELIRHFTEVGIETAKRMEYRWEREKEASYFL